ncbi:endolytic transglycosylase MltG [Aliikangiella sp. IMCC44653]
MAINKLTPLRITFGILLLITFLSVAFQWLSYQSFLQEPLNLQGKQQVKIEIKAGDGVNRLASSLVKQKIISSKLYFKILAWLEPQLAQLKLGEYTIEQSDTPKTLLTKIANGDVIQYSFTIVEGVNFAVLLKQLRQANKLIDDLDDTMPGIAKQLAINEQHLEGWFLPETYQYAKGHKASDILKRAHTQMKQVLEHAWQTKQSELPYKSKYEALIMASIIEKETGVASERSEIAGVFVRRLLKKMRLQTDPTVIYGVGEDYQGDITYRHLRTPTPYNTYIVKGLPPTPIAMPGKESIYAALNPASGTALYFVATGDGGHQFSDTLSEHNKAVKAYLKRQKENKK